MSYVKELKPVTDEFTSVWVEELEFRRTQDGDQSDGWETVGVKRDVLVQCIVAPSKL